MFEKFRYKYDIADDEYIKLYTNGTTDKRQILSNVLDSSIRVSKEIFPDIHQSIAEVMNNLNISGDNFDFFITPAITANAYCIRLDQKSSVVIINSKLIELLSLDELSFVLGHEIGHHIFYHRTENFSMNSSDDIREIILDRSRKMELSCDRIGLLGVKDFNIASMTILKIVSGLGSNFIVNNFKVFLEQLRELQSIGIKDEKDKTHHSWLIRMQALKMFSMSSEYNDFIGSINKGKELNEIDDVIENYLNKLTGIRPDQKQLEIYDKALLFILPKFLYNSFPLNDNERNFFKDRFGKIKTEKISSYITNSSDDQYIVKYNEHIKKINSLDKDLRIKFHKEINDILISFDKELSSSESRLLEIDLGL